MKNYKVLFHGTHKDHVASFKKNGLKANEIRATGNRGRAFLSPRSDVAFAYAVMGGEGQYLNNKGRPKDVPDSDRALIVFHIPNDWYDKHMVREVGGHVPEVSFDVGIPAKFIKQVVVGDRKKVYALNPKEETMMRFKTFIEEMAANATGSVGVSANDVKNIGPRKRKYNILTRGYIEVMGKRKKQIK